MTNSLRHPLPSQEELVFRFDYDPETGDLRWRNSTNPRRVPDGSLIVNESLDGYRRVQIHGRIIHQQIIIWKIMTGTDPCQEVDHKNGVRNDNRWDNLRLATSHQQCLNRRGRTPTHNRPAKCIVRTRSGFQVVLGSWRLGTRFATESVATLDEAITMRDRLALEMYGDR